MSEEPNFHLSGSRFREYGKQLVDWIADCYERAESLPVLSRVAPGEVRLSLPASPPVHGEDFEQVLKDIDRLILPGVTHWHSPKFHAFFPANGSGPAILGGLLSSALGVQGMLWATSPACTELETHVLDWLVGMLGLPDKFLSSSTGGGVIQDTASSSTLCALLAAREHATNYTSNQTGVHSRLVAYTSTQAHSSVEKAAMIAGIGLDNLRLIETDGNYAMKAQALSAAVERDLREGRVPFFVMGTVGTTSSNAMDPLPEIAEICRRPGRGFTGDHARAGLA